jgi:hypothetical protein
MSLDATTADQLVEHAATKPQAGYAEASSARPGQACARECMVDV